MNHRDRALRVLHLCHTDTETGAGRAAYRVHKAVQAVGLDSRFLTGRKRSADPSVHPWGRQLANLIRAPLDFLPNVVLRRTARSTWSNGWMTRREHRFADGWKPDVLQVHWIGGGFVPWSMLPTWRLPQAWWLHDIRMLTGGCHYTAGCDRFTRECRACPQLEGSGWPDLARHNHRALMHCAERIQPRVIATSRWLADEAARSRTLGRCQVETIPYPLNTDAFRPLGRRLGRDLIGLDTEGDVVLFGALGATADVRKGYDLLLRAVESIGRGKRNVSFVVFGGEKSGCREVGGCPVFSLGPLYDDLSLAAAYSAADVMVVPSREEAFGQTASEALACGTPVVAFRVGGLRDIVVHGENGYLAEPFRSEDLAHGIEEVLQFDRADIRERCRRSAVERYAMAGQGAALARVYQEMADTRAPSADHRS